MIDKEIAELFQKCEELKKQDKENEILEILKNLLKDNKGSWVIIIILLLFGNNYNKEN